MFKALAVIYCIWGFNWVVMRTAGDYFPPVTFVTYRFLLAAIVLSGISYVKRLPLPSKKLMPWIALTGIFAIAFNNIFAQTALPHLGAGFSALLNYTNALWVAILAYFFLGEELTKRKIIGIAISILGLFVLMNVDFDANIAFIPVALLGALSFAIGNIIFKLKLTKCDMIVFNTWQMIFASIFLIISSIVTGQGFGHFTPLSIACILYNGILASALAFFLWSFLLRQMEASKAAVAILATPGVGVLCGVIFLGEPLTFSILCGFILILVGIATVVVKT